MPRMRASISRRSASLTRSVLLSRITSAKAIWFLASGRVAQPVLEPSCVGDGDDGVELGLAADGIVDEEGLGNRRRVGEAGGLDDDGVELALAPHQAFDDPDQVAAHGAAHAAVVHLEDFLVGADDEVVVDADLAEFVDDDGELLPMGLGQDAVEQRGLAGAEIAGEHGDGNLVVSLVVSSWSLGFHSWANSGCGPDIGIFAAGAKSSWSGLRMGRGRRNTTGRGRACPGHLDAKARPFKSARVAMSCLGYRDRRDKTLWEGAGVAGPGLLMAVKPKSG